MPPFLYQFDVLILRIMEHTAAAANTANNHPISHSQSMQKNSQLHLLSLKNIKDDHFC